MIRSTVRFAQRSVPKLSNCQIIQLRSQNNVATAPVSDTDDQWNIARPFKDIPTESPWRFFRQFYAGGRYHNKDFRELLQNLSDEHGDIFVMPAFFGRKPIVVTHNPSDFECVYRNESIWPERKAFATMRHYRHEYRADKFQGVEGLITTQGKTWGDFRSIVNPVLMQHRNVNIYLQKMSAINIEFIKRIKELRNAESLEMPDNFFSDINCWTLESVSVVALDKQLGLLKGQRNKQADMLIHALEDFFRIGYELDVKPSVWRYIATPKYKKLMRAFDIIADTSSSFVDEAIERLQQQQKNGIQKPSHEQGVLEKLLQIDEKVAKVMAMDMLMGGVDTTSSTFVAALLCLATNPEKQALLREEVMSILPEKDSDFPEDVLNHMPYMKACIKEAIRVHPLVLIGNRIVKNDVVLSGYQVPKGTEIYMAMSTVFKNAKYFPQPEKYLPERWLREGDYAEIKMTNPFSYLPFGFGPRTCIGKRIVDLELEAGLARVIRNFKIEFNHSTENAFKTFLISVPNIPLRFKFIDIE